MEGQLGKYDLLERLAVGGMAELFLARSKARHGFQKTVVLKRILPSFAEQPDFVQMFLTEAKLAAGLHHPNIAQVFDFGEDDGSFFFTMEFVAGRNVRQVLLSGHQNKSPMPLSCALRIVDNVAAGLHHAHETRDVDGNPLEIVHRDVSPSNVLVTYDGNIKLVDFGIAKIAARGPGTVAGSLKGKVSYMSPEQCRGELVDRRSDIFSLGTLLWELSTGRKLFGLDTLGLELLKQVERAEIPPPTEVVQNYPPELERIVLRAMKRDREDRYATAQEFRDALEGFTLKHQIPLSSSRLSAHMEKLFPHRNHESISFVSSLLPVPSDLGSGPLSVPATASELSLVATSAELPAPAPPPPAPAGTPAPAPAAPGPRSAASAPRESKPSEPGAPQQPERAVAAASIVLSPAETSEPKTLVAERALERDRTEASGPALEPVTAEPEGSRRGVPPVLWAAAVALLLALGGGAWWQSTQTGTQSHAAASQVTAAKTVPAATATEEPPADKPSPAKPVAEEPAHMPVMLADLRKLGYVERHALLANEPGEVSVELHVGLDLVQANESESPCRTFSDALTIMEGSERPRAFLWAIREANPPTGKTSACKGLGQRLQKLREAVGPVVEPPKPTRHNKKTRNRPRRNAPAAEPPAPVAEPSEPPPAHGIATKLDDDLRGL
ncbi:MAG: serine/threonine protein kinase [Nannocystales bacterium]